jgi:hypothetical protein
MKQYIIASGVRQLSVPAFGGANIAAARTIA